MAGTEISGSGSMVHEEDVDTTPRVLRATNANLEECGSITSQVVSQKSKTFSFRSISGPFSSLWRSHKSNTTLHSDRSCIPFSIASRRSSSPSSTSPSHYYRRHSIGQDNMEHNEGEGWQRPNPLQPPPLRLPAVASLQVKTSSFVVGEEFGRKPCAYVVFDTTCWAQNALQDQLRVCRRGPAEGRVANDPGHLDGLKIAITIDGPAMKRFEVGEPQCQTLRVNDRWVVVVKLAMNENNLAVKLTNSVRARSGTSTSLALIDQFLHRLESDNKRSEPVCVRAVIRGRHAFLPEDTLLETSAVCSVGSLTTTSPTSTLRTTALPTSIIHALDPGPGQFIDLTSITRPEYQLTTDFPADEALTLIKDFRLIFGDEIPRAVDVDLAKLEAHYFYKQRTGSTPRRSSTSRRSLHAASTVMSRLSLRKRNVQ